MFAAEILGKRVHGMRLGGASRGTAPFRPRVSIWVPLHHDMGLMSGVVVPVDVMHLERGV